jgi:DNA-binding MarR family transcriptional regulator
MLNQFVDVTMVDLTPRQIKVWLTLYRDSKNGIAQTAQGYIAQRTGLRRPTVSEVIAELEARGLVRTIYAGGLNRGISRYEVRDAAIR